MEGGSSFNKRKKKGGVVVNSSRKSSIQSHQSHRTRLARSAVAESTVHGRAPCTTRVRAELFFVLPDPGFELGVELEPAPVPVPVPVPGPEPLLETVTWPAISVDERR